MWSDRYNYYNIQSDNSFSQEIETEKVVSVLLQTNCFIRKNHQSFINANTFPWVDIIITRTTDGNFAETVEPLSHVNLIAIVCSKGYQIDQAIYRKVFLKIAAKLNWKLFLEADDDGNENIEIKYV